MGNFLLFLIKNQINCNDDDTLLSKNNNNKYKAPIKKRKHVQNTNNQFVWHKLIKNYKISYLSHTKTENKITHKKWTGPSGFFLYFLFGSLYGSR